MNQRTLGVNCLALLSLIMTANAWASSIDGTFFSVETDKKVYAYSEPIQIEVGCTNPYGEMTIGTSTVSVTAVDLSTNQIVYTAPAMAYNKQLSNHAKNAVLIAEIPAYSLKSGNKKYKILFEFYATSMTTPNGTTRVDNKASTIITVR